MILPRELPEIEKEILRNLADCDMHTGVVARKMCYHRNSIVWRLESIKKKTGINPRSFWGLTQLIKELEG